jgi:cell division protease FtsH
MCSGNTLLIERCAVGERSKELTAYHEAGHAVAAHALGIVIEGVSIVQDEGSLGHTTTPLPENFDSSDEKADAVLEKHLIVGVAGAASEELLTEELSDLMGKNLEVWRSCL